MLDERDACLPPTDLMLQAADLVRAARVECSRIHLQLSLHPQTERGDVYVVVGRFRYKWAEHNLGSGNLDVVGRSSSRHESSDDGSIYLS